MAGAVRTAPRGRYRAWEAGQLAGVSGTTIGQWARRGYVRASVDSRTPHVYAFQDVAEAMVVHELLDRGVPHRDVKAAIERLATRYGDWPLSEAPLATVPGVNRARLVVHEAHADYDVGDKGWQQVIEPERLDELRRQLGRGGWAVRALPDLRHIEVDPDRLSGRPTIRGRRIAAQDVALIASTPGGVELLVEDYELDEREIDDALRWWREVQRLETAAA